MNINYKQPQFELFPANSATLEDINKPKFLLANLTLSLESLVILSILGIMVALFSFSLGVERGKHLAAQTLDERVSAAWNVPARSIAAPVAVAASVTAFHPATVTAVKSYAEPKQASNRGFLTVTGGHYTLQAATYGNEAYARQDALLLKAKGYQSFLIKNGKFWLLCVGNFSTKESAAAYTRKMPGEYRSIQIRRF